MNTRMWKRSWKRLQASGHCGTVVTVLSTTRNEAVADGEPETTIRDSLYSAALGQPLDYLVHWPPARATGGRRLPTLCLLHGRGEQMTSWLPFFDRLDESVRAGLIAPMLAIAPDAPWSSRASWYVDSQYADAADPGYPVETALITDLAAHVDRVIGRWPIGVLASLRGYSMGGAGALRLALAHQPLFGAAIALSPAVYVPLPPRRSTPGHRVLLAVAGAASMPPVTASCPTMRCSTPSIRRFPCGFSSGLATANTHTRIRAMPGTICRPRSPGCTAG